MSIEELITWLEQCPVLHGEKLNWSFLPSYSGWSLTIPKAETEALENLAAWAVQNPPPDSRLRVSGIPEFTSRNNSGIEDISITIQLEES